MGQRTSIDSKRARQLWPGVSTPDNSMRGLRPDLQIPPRDGNTQWRLLVPDGSDVADSHLDERADATRLRWIRTVAGRMAFSDVKRFGTPEGAREALEIAGDLWRATNAGSHRLIGATKGRKVKPGKGTAQAINARAYALLVARIRRYAHKHGRAMPAPMIAAIVKDSGLLAA